MRHPLLIRGFDLGVLKLLGQSRLEQTHFLLVMACVFDDVVSSFVGEHGSQHIVKQSSLSLKTKYGLVDKLGLVLVE